MCGFVSLIGLMDVEARRAAIQAMSHCIRHRGPDDKGLYFDEYVGFGFRRLSILDLTSAANQPMFSDDKRKVIIFNGEIFNYLELREELRSAGHRFRTSSDTEVILHSYEEWGTECLHRFNGMWAFLLYDMDHRKVFGSRDRFGIKPLYVYRHKHCSVFASEIKAILASGFYDPKVNWKTAANYLFRDELDAENETFYAQIKRVPAGSAFEVGIDGRYREWKFWSLNKLEGGRCSRGEDWLATFRDAVRLRLRSDVPVGVCLSGGLDSTSIICMMNELEERSKEQCGNDRVEAFCYMSTEHDEKRFIAATLEKTKAKLHECRATPLEMWEELPKVLYYHDEPVHSMTAVVGYKLFQLARNCGVKVVLNGQGADETLAGYPSYFRNYWFSILGNGQFQRLLSEIHKFCKVHEGNEVKEALKVFEGFFRDKLAGTTCYRKLRTMRELARIEDDKWFSKELVRNLSPGRVTPESGSLEAVLRYSVDRNPLPLYLRVEDRNSMAHGVEARLPFMDYRLVALAFEVGDEMKMRGQWNKWILRSAMKGVIPEVVRLRVDKMGFPTSASKWFGRELYSSAKEIVGSRAFRQRGIYNVKTVENVLERHKNGEAAMTERLFGVLQFELFMRSFGRVCI
jgi:asparagine synthase (glutamine-hydrolysing)